MQGRRGASSARRRASRPPASARRRVPATGSRRQGRASPVLVEVHRGGRLESWHRGSAVAVSPAGDAFIALGDPDEIVYLRSAAKPFQLAPFVASGRFDAYDVPNPTESLAVMAASHSGEDRHVRTVQALLRAGGLSRDVLACGMHPPYDRETAERLIRDREPLTPLRHNCSGKHTGMALHAKAAGWPVESYWQPEHPVQQAALEVIAAVSDTPAEAIGTATDGCGVVTFAVPLRGAALAFARLADPGSIRDAALGEALGRIRDAMLAHPEMVAGERRRFDTALMRAAPGRVVAKGGAEGVEGIGVLESSHARGDGAIGLALKIDDGDGARRAVGVAACGLLAALGVLDERALEGLAEYARPQLTDPRGEASGYLRAALDVTTAAD